MTESPPQAGVHRTPTQHHHGRIALIRLALGELTSRSYVHTPIFQLRKADGILHRGGYFSDA